MARRTKKALEQEIAELRKTVEVLNATVSRLLITPQPSVCLLPHYPCTQPHYPTFIPVSPAVPYIPTQPYPGIPGIQPIGPYDPPVYPNPIWGQGTIVTCETRGVYAGAPVAAGVSVAPLTIAGSNIVFEGAIVPPTMTATLTNPAMQWNTAGCAGPAVAMLATSLSSTSSVH